MDVLNQIYNIGGATLRNLFEIHYPFPSPKEFDYSKNNPNFKIIHSLVSLDFLELIRTHNVEVSYTMFIHNVPLFMCINYFEILFFSSMKSLDWYYAGGRAGVNSRSKNQKYIKKE